MDPKQQRVEWQQNETFVDGEYAVQVNCLPLRTPQFSVALSFQLGDRPPSRFLRVQSSVSLGKASVVGFADRVHALMQQAEASILSQLQTFADADVEQRIEREQRQANRGPKPVVGLSGGPGSGKTARRREQKRNRAA